MKKYIIPSLRLTLVLIVLLCLIYPISIAIAGRFSKGKGDGEKIIKNGKTVGYSLLGQSFTQAKYFWGRPSAASYNAAGSAGSNKGPSNPDYLKEVQARIDTLMKYNPGLKISEIPADLVTASGSGLDPDISEQGAAIQVARVATARKITLQKVRELVSMNTERSFMGLFGPPVVNVLKLNSALDNL
ncbi:potassium-transporting ATPase subunit KdpC [Pedobacter sandarakinus]|uniref:potassium-transporting ATPase subunit KdpC n=1 Tax=Pedobacter sandarakinus TaxID=353156 RepID=UPI0022454E59|nr:potassium-transporting ATPase subunit KdpC [Pedobacter sandarakinus]MCX2575849.1 potassium-transporting ATPase subunit KdpC [Pedobacter sandarakinus]